MFNGCNLLQSGGSGCHNRPLTKSLMMTMMDDNDDDDNDDDDNDDDDQDTSDGASDDCFAF